MPTPLHVLILEDCPADVELMVHELRRAGFEPRWQHVATESDFLAGLAPPPDIILADYTLPQFDALRALRYVQERAPDLPLIVVTGALSDEAAVACLKQGAADYLLKDRLGRLGEAVRQALAARDLRVQHRQAHDALRASEERFRALSEHASDLVGILDAEGTYRYASPSHRRILGYAPAEVQGRNVFELMHPDDVLHAQATFAAIMQTPGAMEAAEFRMRHANGSWRTLEGIGTNRLHDPAVRGIIANARDITERKRAEAERVLLLAREQAARQVAEARAQLAAIVDASGDAIIGYALDGTITSWNPAAARLHGYSAAEAIGQSVSLLVPPDRRDELPELLACVAQGESIPHFDTERLRKDGTRIAVSVSIAPVRAASGTVVSAAVVARDITERKRVEAALRESEARLSAILDATPDASVIADGEGRIARVNAATERLFGYGRKELLGQPVELLLPERFRRDHVQHRASYLAAPHPRPMHTGLDLYARHKDASEFPVEISLSPVETAEGMLTISAIRDVTERKRAEAALEESNRELARSNAELEQFASIASHDLRSPLNTIGGYAQLVAKRYKGKLDADADEFLAFIVDAVQRMQQLIDDLLSYARVGTQPSPPEPVACAALVDEVTAQLRRAIAESGTVITCHDLPTVFGQASQLGQVFQNLIANAIKFRGEAPPRVNVSAQRNGKEWLFTVQDNGIGIDPAQAERIFVPFQRLHTREEYPGAGIGLAVCKKIVERHGGHIWVESEPGRGARFLFTLRARPAAPATPHTPATRDTRAALVSSRRS
jgi:PAS domain S-box-containing protein